MVERDSPDCHLSWKEGVGLRDMKMDPKQPYKDAITCRHCLNKLLVLVFLCCWNKLLET